MRTQKEIRQFKPSIPAEDIEIRTLVLSDFDLSETDGYVVLKTDDREVIVNLKG